MEINRRYYFWSASYIEQAKLNNYKKTKTKKNLKIISLFSTHKIKKFDSFCFNQIAVY